MRCIFLFLCPDVLCCGCAAVHSCGASAETCSASVKTGWENGDVREGGRCFPAGEGGLVAAVREGLYISFQSAVFCPFHGRTSEQIPVLLFCEV